MRPIVFSLVLLCLTLWASEGHTFSYTHADVTYGYVDTDAETGGGLGLGVSAAMRPNTHLFGGFGSVDGDTRVTLGAGYRHKARSDMDVVLRAAFMDIAKENGLRLDGGVRTWISNLDVHTGLFVVNLDSNNDAGVFAQAVSTITGGLGLVAKLAFSDAYTVLEVGLRFAY
ncbi:MAG: hypothetical protein ACE5FN_08360 [Leptospirillia bacterium]